MPFPGREGGFDSENVQTATVVPAGWYTAVIAQSATKQTKAGTGSYLSLMFKIFGGDFNGRTVWINLNLDNPNAIAVEIAERELANICKAVGILAPDEPDELHGIPLRIKVAIRPETSTFPEGNDVKGFDACSQEQIDAYENDDPADVAFSSAGAGGDGDEFDDDIPF